MLLVVYRYHVMIRLWHGSMSPLPDVLLLVATVLISKIDKKIDCTDKVQGAVDL